MRRKSLWLSLGLFALIAGAVGTTLVLMVQHEPAFYGKAAVPSGQQRNNVSGEFATRWFDFFDLIKAGGDPKTGQWGIRSSEVEINSYLAEHFETWGIASKLLPEGVSDPRVAIDKDRIRLGFRYGTPPWSTVISVDFRIWLAQAEPNVLVLELKGLKAGSLPIAAQSLLEQLSEALGRQNIQVAWYSHGGNPTAALKFQSDQPRPLSQLQQLDIRPGMLVIAGQSTEFQVNSSPGTSAPGGQ